MDTHDLHPEIVLAGFESTMEALRRMPPFRPDGFVLLGRMSHLASRDFEHGVALAVRTHVALMDIAIEARKQYHG